MRCRMYVRIMSASPRVGMSASPNSFPLQISRPQNKTVSTRYSSGMEHLYGLSLMRSFPLAALVLLTTWSHWHQHRYLGHIELISLSGWVPSSVP